jgi:hypothetical protein
MYCTKLELRTAIIGFISLLGSGVISAIGFIAIASGRLSLFDAAGSSFVILFVQWQTLGLTIAKLGIDQVVFAAVSKDETASLSPINYVKYNPVVLAGVFSIIMFFVFSPLASIIAFMSIIIDTMSIIIVSDLNARKKYKITAVSNLLNYPLFFLILIIISYYKLLNVNTALLVFLTTSSIRYIWLSINRHIQPNMNEIQCINQLQMGLQQILNYLLFKADQILLAVIGLNNPLSEYVIMYVFMSKLPELLSNVMIIAGTIVFPKIYIRYPFTSNEILRKVSNNIIYWIGYLAIIVLALFIYDLMWKGTPVPLYLKLSIIINSASIFLINNITYSMLRQGYLNMLTRNLFYSVLIGIVPVLYLIGNFSILVLSLIIPIQVSVFIMMAVFVNWENNRVIHAQAR